MPEIIPLRSSRTGGNIFSQWVAQASQTPAVDSQLSILIPTQEMRPFQREVRTFTDDQASVPIGQRATFRAIVPEGEAWRILWIGVRHSDPGTLTWGVSLESATPTSIDFLPIRTNVDADTDTPLYPANTQSGSSNRFNWNTSPELEAFQGDAVRVAMISPASGILLATVLLRYELIPIPLVLRADDVWVGSTA